MNENLNVQPNVVVNQPMQPQKKNNKVLGIVIASVAVVALIILVIVLASGGGKTLVCTQEQDMFGMAMTGEVKVKFENDKVDKMNMTVSVDLGEYAAYKDTFIESFEEEYEDYKEEGMDVKVTSDKSHVYVKLEADRDNFKEAGISTYESYDEVKNDLEEQGFICK